MRVVSAAGGAETVGEISEGLCVLVGITHTDRPEDAKRLADKVWNLRVMPSGDRPMELAVADTTREILVVSQFTLYGDASRGRRPSWVAAAPPEIAEPLYECFVAELRALGAHVRCGVFGASMEVELVNWGPVTLMLETGSPRAG